MTHLALGYSGLTHFFLMVFVNLLFRLPFWRGTGLGLPRPPVDSGQSSCVVFCVGLHSNSAHDANRLDTLFSDSHLCMGHIRWEHCVALILHYLLVVATFSLNARVVSYTCRLKYKTSLFAFLTFTSSTVSLNVQALLTKWRTAVWGRWPTNHIFLLFVSTATVG